MKFIVEARSDLLFGERFNVVGKNARNEAGNFCKKNNGKLYKVEIKELGGKD